ncbi:unnamed protein product [Vicia faba]|uniref:Uncharacterized protein n=1 Tax=Vicia faba TaxID=3906 RepID=A0AAV1AGP6_VICFA|nr:unnamed protein product [Vicia faba]
MARGRGCPKKKVPSLMLANVLKQSGRKNDSERSSTIEPEIGLIVMVEEEKTATLDVNEVINQKVEAEEKSKNNPVEPKSSSWITTKSSGRHKGKIEEYVHDIRCQIGFHVFKIGGLEDILDTGT